MRHRFASRHALAALICIAACKGEENPASTVRDSAGIRVVDNARPVWSAGQGWRLDSIPDLDVGPRDALFEIGAMYRLEDGRIIVAHLSASELLLYSPDGALLRRIGRRGSGPGEFREISGMFLIAGGDSILVYDYPSRLSVFDTAGNLGSTRSLSAGGDVFVRGALDDGSLIVQASNPPTLQARGLVRTPSSLSRITPDGATIPIAPVPGMPIHYQDAASGGGVDFRPPFFAHATYTTSGHDRVVWGATDTFQIHVHGTDGRLTSLVRREHTPKPVTDADVAPLIEQRVAAARDDATRAGIRRMLGNLPRGTIPAFGAPSELGAPLQFDADGNLWVAEYAMPGETRNARAVFDSSGTWLGLVTLPPRFAPRHIGHDFVLGRWRDSLDVEHIRLYRLRKPG